jgi:hypothetical protein
MGEIFNFTVPLYGGWAATLKIGIKGTALTIVELRI